MMENYRPNSNRFKEEQKNKDRDKKVEKVVTGAVITRKKSKVRKFTDEFISEDAKNVKTYVFGEVLIPALKKAIVDIITDGANMIFYGESKRGEKRSTADRVSYRSYYGDDRRDSRSNRTTARTAYSYDDIILTTRGEAEDVLDRMDEMMDTYGLVRVADLFDLVGVSGTPEDNSYGWTNIRNAEIVRVREGYMIKMPRALPIDR